MIRVCLTLFSICLAVSATQAQEPENSYSGQIKVFQLENLDPEAAARMLKDVLGKSDGETLTVNPEQKNLIVNGSPKRLELIEAILLKLDESPKKSPGTLRVYQLKFAKALELVGVLSDVFSGRDDLNSIRLGVDDKTNSVVAYGSTKAHEEIVQLIESLDRVTSPEVQQVAKSIRFEVYWIAEGVKGREVPEEVEKVLSKQGDKLGIQMPSLVASASTACYLDGTNRSGMISFRNIKGAETLELDCEAMVTPLSDKAFKLDLRLSAGGASKTAIQTTVRTQIDHLVFVASTTISGETVKPTVFVLKVSEEQDSTPVKVAE